MKLFLIAEIGINHNGDLNIAKKLITEAKNAGFDSVKFQKRDINLVYSKEYLETYRESPWGKTQRKQKEGIEFGRKQYNEIDKFCKKLKIHWFASAWDLNSLKFLDKYKFKYNKIASAMLVDLELLKEVAKRKKYTFISTGMSTIKDIKNAVKIFKKFKCKFELMHTVSTYPMKDENANLITIKKLKEKFKCNVGYSGHEIGLAVSYAAFNMGISSLERHITLNRAMYGTDQAASVESNGMVQLIKNIRIMEKSIGKNRMGYIYPEEKKISNKLREHISTYKPFK